MKLESRMRTVYFAPTRRRHYQTLRAAANAEARAQIEHKYPTEHGDAEIGDWGWHWSSDERLVRVHKRLTRMLLNGFFR